ncbi:MAG: hypothetical protein ACFFCS_01315 [Candidatus Hodarchaeota archaeon]
MPVITGRQMKEIYRTIARLPVRLRSNRRYVDKLFKSLVDMKAGNTYTLEEAKRKLRNLRRRRLRF